MQTKTNKPRKTYKSLERHYTVEEVCDALRKFYGLIKPASQYLKCSRMTIYRYLEKHPEAKRIVEEGREELLDSAETVLVKILNGGLEASTGEMLDAAKYVTSTIGKNRGYTTKTETQIESQDFVVNVITAPEPKN